VALSPDFGDVLVGSKAAERLKPPDKVVGGIEVGKVRPKLVMALAVERLTAASLLVQCVRSTYPLDQGRFGLVSRWSISFASQIMSNRI
jgi:hypothetical protein